MNVATAPRVLVDGEPGESIAVDDRGLALGDGLFETIGVRGGRPRFWAAHRERLSGGCDRLDIPAPDMDALRADVERVIAGDDQGSLRVTVTRGRGPRGYAPPPDPQPTRIVAFQPGPAAAAAPAPIAVRWCRTRLALQPALAGLKHLNRLEQVLARAEWNDPAIGEGLMRATDGRVVEGVMSNLFLVTGDGSLATPALDECGVAGVMRRLTLEAAAWADVPVHVRRIEPADVESAAGVFMCNALRGLVPVVRLDAREWPVPESLLARLRDRVAALDA